MLLDCIPRLHGFDVKTPGLTSLCGRLYSRKVAQSTPATSKCFKHCRRWHHSGILSVLGISVGSYERGEILPVCITAGERGENSVCLPWQQCFCVFAACCEHITSCALPCVSSCKVEVALQDTVIPAWHAATAHLMLFPSQEQTDVTLPENSGLCGLLLQAHSWLECLLQKFVCDMYPERLHTQNTMEEVTQERAKVPRSSEGGKWKRPLPWSLYLKAALQEQIQGCNLILPTFPMAVPAVQYPLMGAGRAPPGPLVDICWDWTVKVVLQCRGEGKVYIREWRRAGDKIKPNEPLLFLWMCSESVCSLGSWCHFDSGNILFNPFKQYVMGCICKCTCIEVTLRPLLSWYCFHDVFWGAGCRGWAGFPIDIDQNDHFCCASRCRFQLCRILFFFQEWICGKVRKRLLHSPDAFFFDTVLQRVRSPQTAAWCLVSVCVILLGCVGGLSRVEEAKFSKFCNCAACRLLSLDKTTPFSLF